ncbi:MAG: polymerase sigma factor [Frankiales bacterium]|nr:polymerase sigma factor [Frankiales bacterium]
MCVEAVEEFVAAQYEPLRRAAYLLCGDVDAADDLVQTTSKVWRRWNRVSGAQDPVAYTHRVLINTYRARRRRMWVRESPTDLSQATVQAGSDPVVDRLALRQALLTLPLDQRQAVVLRHLLGLNELETSRALDCPVGTVKSRTSRGLAALRPLLKEEVDST